MIIALFGHFFAASKHFCSKFLGISTLVTYAFLLPSWKRKTSGHITTQMPAMSHLFGSTVAFIKPPWQVANMDGIQLQRSDSSGAAMKFEILNPKHETNPNFKFFNVQNKSE